MSEFKAIVAVAQNGVIGCGMKIPWHISEDFKHFKRTTLGGVVAMGRRTWESLGGRPLPGRENVVLTSRGGVFSGAETAKAWKSLPRATVAIRAPFGFAGGGNIPAGSANVFGGRVEPRENVAGWGHLFPRYIRRFRAVRKDFRIGAI